MKSKRVRHYPIGSISSGTTRPEDLIPTFLSELESLLKRGPSLSREQRNECLTILGQRVTDGETYWDSEQPGMDLEILFNVLDYFSGPYIYFGAHPGDGSDYGWWTSDSLRCDFDGIKVNDLSEVPKGYRGEVLHVSDHGNMTLYVKHSRGFKEIWAVV